MQSVPTARKAVELLESRLFLSASPLKAAAAKALPAPYQHVLIVSVDGLHQADVTDPALQQTLANIESLKAHGISYSHASTTKPSDSFPGTLAYLTGAGPGTTGVFYDDSYSRTLRPPGSSASAKPGTEVVYAENLDKNQSLLSGGGNFDASSIDPSQLPVDSHGNVVYPHQFLKVNTIFNVAHNAGLYTAFGDKHPSYEIANGPSGNGIDDFYSPEINSMVALLDPTTHMTVNADALLAANPYTDVSKYTLVDPSTDPVAVNPSTGMSADPNLQDPTTNVLLCERYDDLKVQADLNEINGMNSRGTHSAPVPNLFGLNFQAVSVAEKDFNGGVQLLPNGQGIPTDILKAAMAHTDASIGKLVGALKANGLWSSTLIALTAKHGQAPRIGHAGLMADTTIPNLLAKAGAPVAQATQDDVSLIWLQDQATTSVAVSALQTFKATGTIDVYFKGVKQTLPANQVINQILSGAALQQNGLGNPATDSSTPDIIVTLKPGYVWVGKPATGYAHKNGEHGGFSADDTHVPLILSGGSFPAVFSGKVVSQQVQTRQIAVTALDALGLDARQLKGAVAEHTQALPGFRAGKTFFDVDAGPASGQDNPGNDDSKRRSRDSKILQNEGPELLG